MSRITLLSPMKVINLPARVLTELTAEPCQSVN